MGICIQVRSLKMVGRLAMLFPSFSIFQLACAKRPLEIRSAQCSTLSALGNLIVTDSHIGTLTVQGTSITLRESVVDTLIIRCTDIALCCCLLWRRIPEVRIEAGARVRERIVFEGSRGRVTLWGGRRRGRYPHHEGNGHLVLNGHVESVLEDELAMLSSEAASGLARGIVAKNSTITITPS